MGVKIPRKVVHMSTIFMRFPATFPQMPCFYQSREIVLSICNKRASKGGQLHMMTSIHRKFHGFIPCRLYGK